MIIQQATINEKALNGYIERVIQDAKDAVTQAYQKQNLSLGVIKVEYQYRILIDNLVFALRVRHSTSQKMTYLIIGRLGRNIHKHFGLYFHPVFPDYTNLQHYEDMRRNDIKPNCTFDLFNTSIDCVDANFSIDLWQVFGELSTIRCLSINNHINFNDPDATKHLESLREHGYDYRKDYSCSKESRWRTFLQAYTAAYGVSPLDNWEQKYRSLQEKK